MADHWLVTDRSFSQSACNMFDIIIFHVPCLSLLLTLLSTESLHPAMTSYADHG